MMGRYPLLLLEFGHCREALPGYTCKDAVRAYHRKRNQQIASMSTLHCRVSQEEEILTGILLPFDAFLPHNVSQPHQ